MGRRLVINPAGLFASLPATLRSELLQCHREIVRNYVEQRWEPAELNGGKLCEVAYSIVKGALTGSFPAFASKPSNMVLACRDLEQIAADSTRVGDRSLRVLIPRLLPFLYEIRNNRGVGHVGGEVDPNHEDAEAVLGMANWLLAEMIRVFHDVPLHEAQAVVESLVSKRLPIVWEVEGTKRVLDPTMSKSDQAVLLLYAQSGWTDETVLHGWVEYSSIAKFRSNILDKLHEARVIEYERPKKRVRITPRGIQYAEEKLLPK